MQILPSTALDIAHTTGGTGFVVGDLDDPRVNILYGCYYLRLLLDHYHGSLVEAVAAYNAGSGQVDEWAASAAARHQSFRTSDILFSETRNYVSDVLRLRTIYRHAYGHDLRE
jgi:soluble lytic murein transglycosylase